MDANTRTETGELAETTRRLEFEDYPRIGHMLVISKAWDAVYWLADRHAVIRAGAVELDGPGRRLLEARADDHGMVTFENVREYDVTSVVEGTAAARAVAVLTDPTRIDETLYPPYIPDITKRPARPYLQHPEGLSWRDAVVLDRQRGEIYWLLRDHGDIEDSGVFTAPVCGYGLVYWGSTYVSRHHPDWVLPALIDQASR